MSERTPEPLTPEERGDLAVLLSRHGWSPEQVVAALDTRGVPVTSPATEAKPCECGLREALDRIGAKSSRLSRIAEVALTPDGSHTLIDGYCPDCQGGCMRGFLDPEPVHYVEPSPILIPAEWAVRSADDASALLKRIQDAAERAKPVEP